MTDLSPAAQAVLHAVTLKRYDVPYQACPKSIDQIRSDVAAALRAVADQVCHHWDGAECVDYLCAIAAELETFTTEN
jgi:hypothetical protein